MKCLFIIVVCLMLTISSAIAQINNLTPIFIFHINGVNTTKTEAIQNLKALELVANLDSRNIKWDILYNPTHGSLASDLADTFRQKKQESKNLTIDDYVAVWMKTYHLHYSIDSDEYKKLKAEIKEDYLKDPAFVGSNLSEMVDEYHQKIHSSVVNYLKKVNNPNVLFVPHSQGVLYANQLYDYLISTENYSKDHLKIFGVASPASVIKGREVDNSRGEGYVTATHDFVINSLKYFSYFLPITKVPLSPNIQLSESADRLCHSLIDAYLLDVESRDLIGKEINTLVKEFLSGQ